jgi:hypothetical protein
MPLIDQEGLNIIRTFTSGVQNGVSPESIGLDEEDSASGMPDAGIIGVWTKLGEDEMGQPINNWIYGSEISCRFHLISASQQQEVAGQSQIETSDATCHIPLGNVINKKDRFRLTKRWGLPVINQEWEISGAFVVNAADITIHLRLITNVVG